MSYTPQHLDALKEAIASGVLRLSYEGRTVEYRSMDELKAALNEVENALSREQGKTPVRQIRIIAHKDL